MTAYKNASGLAWLRRDGNTSALRVRGFAAAPESFSFFAPDFALSLSEPWLVGEPCAISLVAEPLPHVVHRAEPSSADFAQMHENILSQISARVFEKVVPIVCEDVEFACALKPEMFAAAITSDFAHQFNYGFSFDGQGLCGVTPEILFSVRGNRLQTMALAGTGKVDGPSLLGDPKEMHEHRVVIEHITRELELFGRAEVGVTREQIYGALKHLYTPIELKLARRPDFMELVVRLHPTAALGGWPRRPAVEWLEAQSFHESRGRFGAPFGFVDRDTMFCVVAIRGLQWKGAKARLSAGCGVVAQSQGLREWNELQLKRDATRRFLGLDA